MIIDDNPIRSTFNNFQSWAEFIYFNVIDASSMNHRYGKNENLTDDHRND